MSTAAIDVERQTSRRPENAMTADRDPLREPEAVSRGPDGITVVPMAEDSIPEVERIHVEAFAGYMNTRLGRSYMRAFFNWFLTAPGGVALIARDEKAGVLGYLVGAPIDYGPRMNRDLARVAAVSVALRPWLLLHRTFWTIIATRLRSYLGRTPIPHASPLPDPALSLIAIGVGREARGKKVGALLVRAFEDRARGLRARSLQLTVYENNSIARKLYETAGWVQRGDVVGHGRIVEYVRILEAGDDRQRMEA